MSKTCTKICISKMTFCDNENDSFKLKYVVLYKAFSCVGVKLINIKFKKGNFYEFIRTQGILCREVNKGISQFISLILCVQKKLFYKYVKTVSVKNVCYTIDGLSPRIMFWICDCQEV